MSFLAVWLSIGSLSIPCLLFEGFIERVCGEALQRACPSVRRNLFLCSLRRHSDFSCAISRFCCSSIISPIQREPDQALPVVLNLEVATMGGSEIFDLEKHFAFYGAYHSNKINILIHVCFVWPILFTAFVLLAYTNPLVPQLPVMAGLPYHEYIVFNWSFVAAAAYALFYVVLEPKSGSLGALLVLLCCMGANAVAQQIPYAAGWKIVAISQVLCWSFQFIGHGVFEKRAPALIDNIVQAFLMAPYFVMLEILHTIFHFEPYPGFSKNVQNKVGTDTAEFRAKKAKANM